MRDAGTLDMERVGATLRHYLGDDERLDRLGELAETE